MPLVLLYKFYSVPLRGTTTHLCAKEINNSVSEIQAGRSLPQAYSSITKSGSTRRIVNTIVVGNATTNTNSTV